MRTSLISCIVPLALKRENLRGRALSASKELLSTSDKYSLCGTI